MHLQYLVYSPTTGLVIFTENGIVIALSFQCCLFAFHDPYIICLWMIPWVLPKCGEAFNAISFNFSHF